MMIGIPRERISSENRVSIIPSDMPVVVALLNAYFGLAGAATGYGLAVAGHVAPDKTTDLSGSEVPVLQGQGQTKKGRPVTD